MVWFRYPQYMAVVGDCARSICFRRADGDPQPPHALVVLRRLFAKAVALTLATREISLPRPVRKRGLVGGGVFKSFAGGLRCGGAEEGLTTGRAGIVRCSA